MQASRKELLAALGPLKPALAGRSVVTALTHIWFDGKYAYAHDGGMGARVEVETPFKLGVSGASLLGLLGQAGPDELKLEEEDAALVFKAGRSTVKLVTLPLQDMVWPYPSKAVGKPKASLKVSRAFVLGLKRVFVVRAASPQRMEHYSVCVFAAGEGDAEMDLYTTDSKALAVMPVAEKLEGSAGQIAIPRAFAEQLVAQCKEGAELRMMPDHFVVAASEKVTLFSNVFDTSAMLDMPAVADKHMDTKAAPPFTVPEGFAEALERVLLLAGGEEAVVTLQTSGKVLALTGSFAKTGELDEEFTVDKSLPKCSVDLVAKSLLGARDVKQAMVSKDAVVLLGADKFMYVIARHTAAPAKAAKKSAE